VRSRDGGGRGGFRRFLLEWLEAFVLWALLYGLATAFLQESFPPPAHNPVSNAIGRAGNPTIPARSQPNN
jgi:hypothetical protein